MTRMTGPDCVVMCNLINTYIHMYPGDLVEGTQEGQTSYLSGDVPVECVRPMPASLTAARGPGTVSTVVNGKQ